MKPVMTLIDVVKLETWFASCLKTMRCSDDAKAYVTGVMCKFQRDTCDPFDGSIVLAYAAAKDNCDFASYQNVGDRALWVSVVHDIASGDRELVEHVGRLSYRTCYRLTRMSWPVYDELAENLSMIVDDVRHKIMPAAAEG